jgi:8-oxo-dGTP diphosphatase
MAKVIRAVAGILCHNTEVLLVTRPLGKSFPLHWEFPGGKIEVDETTIDALARELYEEIGILVDKKYCEPLTVINQSYPHGEVRLDVMLVKKWDNQPKALEQQQLVWYDLNQECQQTPLLITTDRILNLLRHKLSLT